MATHSSILAWRILRTEELGGLQSTGSKKLKVVICLGRWEGGSGLGTRVHPWWIHVDVWQNQYNIVK